MRSHRASSTHRGHVPQWQRFTLGQRTMASFASRAGFLRDSRPREILAWVASNSSIIRGSASSMGFASSHPGGLLLYKNRYRLETIFFEDSARGVPVPGKVGAYLRQRDWRPLAVLSVMRRGDTEHGVVFLRQTRFVHLAIHED